MFARPKHRSAEVSASSVADIAFLLLSFFLMTTVIETETGLSLQLPEWRDEKIDVPIHERNVFKIHLNSNDQVMIEGDISKLDGLKERVKEFVLNNGSKSDLSESPEKAIVSLKSDRGTTHQAFIRALDEIQGAYYEIYASRVNMKVKDYRNLNIENPVHAGIINNAKEGTPMNISLAEPSGASSGN